MKMDIDLLKHEVEINHLRKMTKSRKLGPTLGIFPPLVLYSLSPESRAIDSNLHSYPACSAKICLAF